MMNKIDFEFEYSIYKDFISDLAKVAFSLHENVNQKYGMFPYSVHLHKTLEKALKYGQNVAEVNSDVLILCISALFHDVLEDTRTTYNDLKNILIKNGCDDYITHNVAEIVWAVTQPIGRNRKERQCPEYYAKISAHKFASFIKMCDRLANLEMSKYYSGQKMTMYKKEEFLSNIDKSEICEEMLNEYKELTK